ncbi:hybrid sensor histidine kinase/response regulator [Halobacteriales archaeon QS_9_68_42]|nr:MAG: hybrid sensor histidine kinase/response regulator [Halobacteriales archaeon QS_9_68_42]
MSSELRVLYVDADPAMTEAVRESLEAAGFSVEAVASADEGTAQLEAADAPGFDCVVSALELPDADGLEFLRSVRSEYPSVPFILYPDAGSETVASEAISASVTDYIPRADRTGHERLLEAVREAVETANREHFGSLFEHLPTAVVYGEIQPDGPVVERVNPAFEETFGYGTEEMIGENLDELIVPEGHRDGAVEINERLLAGERIHTEVRRLTPEGVRDFRLDVLGPEGTLEGYAIYTDVTESKRRQRELERQNERLEKFVSVVSHDLRSPLSVAKGNLKLANEEYDDPRLTDAADAVDRMNALIGDLLTLAREGERVNEVEPVDLGGVAEDCWEGVRTEAATLETESAPEIEADRSRVRQVLSNLLRNAVEHSSTSSRPKADDAVEHGSTSPPSHAQEDAGSENASEPSVANAPEDAVEHSSTSPPSHAQEDAGSEDASEPSVANAPEDAVEHGGWDVTVTVGDLDRGFYVADDGPGIPEEERDRVFESGYTTAKEGTGFGLSIVAEIAEAHGWEIEVTESADGGARFEVTGVALADG